MRALARQLGVDLSQVQPSGPDNSITSLDVQQAAQAHKEAVLATITDEADVDVWSQQEDDVMLRLIRAIDVATDFCNLDLNGTRVVVQGFGSVGKHAARFLVEKGATLVGVSDSRGTLYDAQGFDVAELIAFKESGHAVIEFAQGEKLDHSAIIAIDCDIWIPAARPDVLTAANAHNLNTRIVAQGANIPATAEAEQILHEKGILVLPDFIANAGGVICAAVEYAGGNETQALSMIDEKIRNNTREMLENALTQKIPPRQAALALAEQRISKAMSLRRRF